MVGCLGNVVIFLLLAFRQHVGHDAFTFRDPFATIFVRVHDKLIVRDTKHPALFQLLGTRKMHKMSFDQNVIGLGKKTNLLGQRQNIVVKEPNLPT
jgi:hypothetical protein